MTLIQHLTRLDFHLAEAAAISQRLHAMLGAATPPPPTRPPLARSLVGDVWAARAARGTVGVLVEHIQSGQKSNLAYGDLHKILVSHGAKDAVGSMQKYAKPLHRICLSFRDLTERTGQPVPLLTVLIVNGRTGLPGSGSDLKTGINEHLFVWLKAVGRDDLTAKIPTDEKGEVPPELFDFAREAVFAYRQWDEAVQAIGLSGNPATDMARAQ